MKPYPQNKTYEGFETLSNQLMMTAKMIFVVIVIAFVLHIGLFILSFSVAFKEYERKAVFSWVSAKMLNPLNPQRLIQFKYSDGRVVVYTAEEIATSKSVQNFVDKRISKIITLFFVTMISYIVVPLFIFYFKKRSTSQSKKKHIRGSQLLTEQEYRDQTRKNKDPLDLDFGGVKMPVDSETQHLYVLGSPGTGKTTLLSQVLEELIQRGEKVVVYDYKGDYLEKFYNPKKDKIFNPLDKRSLGWNIFNEIHNAMDIDAIAASLIPQAESSEKFWNDGARDVFAGILHFIMSLPKVYHRNKDIWAMVTSDNAVLKSCLKKIPGGERGAKYIENPRDPQTAGVVAVLMQYAKCFEYMQYMDGDFHLKEWLYSGSGTIFVSNYSNIKDTLRPILSLFIDLMGRRLLAMPDDRNRRFFFLLDEFGTLQKLPTIIDLLKLARSKGGCVFISVQDIGQIDHLYQKDNRQTIINACSNSTYFKVNDEITAKHCSERLGQSEIIEAAKTYSLGVTSFRDGTNIALQKKKEDLFLSSEIMNLKRFQCIVKFSEYFPVLTNLKAKFFEIKNESFSIRPDLIIEDKEIIVKTTEKPEKELDIDFKMDGVTD